MTLEPGRKFEHVFPFFAFETLAAMPTLPWAKAFVALLPAPPVLQISSALVEPRREFIPSQRPLADMAFPKTVKPAAF